MVKKLSLVLGVVFVIAGVWGFFSETVLWFLAADMVSSIIHVIVGVVLLVMASKPEVVITLKVVGVLYVVFAVLGFISLNFFVVNGGTNLFYLVVGVVMAVLGWTAKGSSPMMSPPSQAPQM